MSRLTCSSSPDRRRDEVSQLKEQEEHGAKGEQWEQGRRGGASPAASMSGCVLGNERSRKAPRAMGGAGRAAAPVSQSRGPPVYNPGSRQPSGDASPQVRALTWVCVTPSPGASEASGGTGCESKSEVLGYIQKLVNR